MKVFIGRNGFGRGLGLHAGQLADALRRGARFLRRGRCLAGQQRHHVAGRIRFLHGSLLAPLPGPVDLIAANLPYVMSAELPTLDPEVRLFEPHEALDGGEDGLDLVRELLTQVPDKLIPGGAVLLVAAVIVNERIRRADLASEVALLVGTRIPIGHVKIGLGSHARRALPETVGLVFL